MKQKEEKQLLQTMRDFLDSDTSGAAITRVLLATIALGGIVFIGAVAPNIFKAVASGNYTLQGKSSGVKKSFQRLKKNGFILLERHKNGKVSVLLTEKGKQYLHTNREDYITIKKPIIWDRKWRVVIFDIPVEKDTARDMFRAKIKNLGFYQMQKSVWVYPYKCEDEVLFFARRYGVSDFVEILTVKKLIHAPEIKKIFDL